MMKPIFIEVTVLQPAILQKELPRVRYLGISGTITLTYNVSTA